MNCMIRSTLFLFMCNLHLQYVFRGIFHPLDTFKVTKGKDKVKPDRLMTTMAMNTDPAFISVEDDQMRNHRTTFFQRMHEQLRQCTILMKKLYPRHTAYIAILKSASDQVSKQAIHVDFNPKLEKPKTLEELSFSIIIPLNDFCNVNLMSEGCTETTIAIPLGFMLKFLSGQAHGGGTNTCGSVQYRLHAYFCINKEDAPRNEVFKVQL